MCGVAGIWDRHAATTRDALATAADAMAATVDHRGPDGRGLWVDEAAGIALGHRRLSIIELSDAGAQPMSSADGRFVLAYNGEVYNAAALRRELERQGCRFRGHSDTEVIVEGCAAWGIDATLERLVGMFAFALWDRRARALHLVRDRLGIKPMYWTEIGATLIFGSELKALRTHAAWHPALDRNALASFLRLMYVPAPQTIYAGVHKLPPGTILTVGAAAPTAIRPYWTLDQAIDDGRRAPFAGGDDAAVEALDRAIGDAVRGHMVSDVPLGAFLSGGIDSSLVVAMMQKIDRGHVRTFSIGFHEPGWNEAQHAAAVARHLGTDHHELYVTPTQATDVIPRLPDLYDEPFADPSAIPTFLLSQMARQQVKVALSGDGGDELFAGYDRYRQALSVWRQTQRLPLGVRRMAAAAIRALPPRAWSALGRAAPRGLRLPFLGDKLHKLAGVIADPGDSLFRVMVSHWHEAETLVTGGAETRGIMWDPRVAELVPDFLQRMQYLDTLAYLPDDVLTKVDRASMATALEVRVPLLDHRLVAFSWTLPSAMKLRDGAGKWILRRVLDRYVPRALVDRPKMGFGVPIGSWLRGPLRDWAEALIAEPRLAREGVLDPVPIRARWNEHLAGTRNWQYPLWDILMFQAWKERWLP